MKRFTYFVVAVLILVFSSSPVFSATKYDRCLKGTNLKVLEETYNKVIVQNRLYYDYLNLLFSREDLVKLAKNRAFEPEMCKFLLERTDPMIQYLHIVFAKLIATKLKPTNNELIYVIGVIKDPHAQAATNGVEYEQEKMFLRNMKLYAFWEFMHENGNPSKVISEEIASLYNLSLKQK
jgi:hypothetical protein